MKRALIFIALTVFILNLHAQEGKTIQLNEHSKIRKIDLMEAFQNRQSIRSFETQDLTLQDLSDLLWAANGINRPQSGRKTAPSAINSQDVDIYVCRADGAYIYDAASNRLKLIINQDIRQLSEGNRSSGAPVILLLVTDISRYKSYKPGDKEANQKITELGILDAGIVSQNIGIFCAGAGLGTVPRARMDAEGIHKALNLKESQTVWLNHPVGYPKK